jgi:hypothetical protein
MSASFSAAFAIVAVEININAEATIAFMFVIDPMRCCLWPASGTAGPGAVIPPWAQRQPGGKTSSAASIVKTRHFPQTDAAADSRAAATGFTGFLNTCAFATLGKGLFEAVEACPPPAPVHAISFVGAATC